MNEMDTLTKIKTTVEKSETKSGRLFDLTIQGLIIISLIAFSIETLPGLSSEVIGVLEFFEYVSVIIFSIEYVLRILVADRKLSFVFSFYGLVDLLAILPFYLAGGVDLRGVRVFRMFRLVRVLKLVRYSKAIVRFSRAFSLIREELILFFVGCSFLIFVSSVGIYFFERDVQPEEFASVFHSMWWAVATLTTVGYGDIYPITVGGRIFTYLILMTGLGFVALPSGLMASALTQTLENERKAGLSTDGRESTKRKRLKV